MFDVSMKEIPRFQPGHQGQKRPEAGVRTVTEVADPVRRRVSNDHIDGAARTKPPEKQRGQKPGHSNPHLSFAELLGSARPVAYRTPQP